MNILLKYKNKNTFKICDEMKSNDNQYKTIFFNGIHAKEYEIIDTISVKHNKGIYIIKKNDIKYVLKIKNSQSDNLFEQQICSILSQHVHTNIIKFIEYVQGDNFYYIIYEYFEGINLQEYVKKNKNISDNQIKNIIIQISQATKFLHSYNLIT